MESWNLSPFNWRKQSQQFPLAEWWSQAWSPSLFFPNFGLSWIGDLQLLFKYYLKRILKNLPGDVISTVRSWDGICCVSKLRMTTDNLSCCYCFSGFFLRIEAFSWEQRLHREFIKAGASVPGKDWKSGYTSGSVAQVCWMERNSSHDVNIFIKYWTKWYGYNVKEYLMKWEILMI